MFLFPKSATKSSLLPALAMGLSLVLGLTACSGFYFPGVHKISIQQGNVISQQMIDKLRPGMTKNQVIYVMGRPVIQDPLNSQRWDYLYTIQVGEAYESQLDLSLYFINDRLDYFEGDYLPSAEYQRIKATLIQEGDASAPSEKRDTPE